MEEFNFEKIEKRLKNLGLPDFELSQHKNILRRALLNSPYFGKERFIFSFRIAVPALSTALLILLFIFFGYPYLQYSYQEVKAKEILNKAEEAIGNLGPNKEIYALSDKGGLVKFSFGELREAIPTEKLESLKEFQKVTFPFDQNLKKFELRFDQLKEAKERGEIKFLQYIGEEKKDGTILKKIRYVDKNNIVTEIKINSRTNLPAEIITWAPEKEMKKAEMVKNIFSEKEKIAEMKIFEITIQTPRK